MHQVSCQKCNEDQQASFLRGTLNHANNTESGAVQIFLCCPRLQEPPHIHAQREDMVAKFWLEPIVLQKTGGYSRNELNRIAKLVYEHREYFLEEWHEFFGD